VIHNNTVTRNSQQGFYLDSDSSNNALTNNVWNLAYQILQTQSIPIHNSKNTSLYLLEGTVPATTWFDSSISIFDTYTVWQNDHQVKNGFFTTIYEYPHKFISLPLNHLSDGIYEFIILVTNASGGKITDSVHVTIIDNPILNLSSPEDQTFEQGTIGQNISWIAMDPNPTTYIIYLDGIELETGNWSSEVPITIGVHLPTGVYTFTLVVTNTFNFTMSDTVFVFVTDPPIITTTITIVIPPDTTITTSTTITNTSIVIPPETTVITTITNITTITSPGSTIVSAVTSIITSIMSSSETTSTESGSTSGWTIMALLSSIACLFIIRKRRQ
jgi:parallel beta-helix repeat protein